ncbi:hypothetical protein [Flavobacterium sp.]|jgi:hypothetical protein|uniref:hypothetical protein n=1 Tax=Flavobacterium sp. TaxID=239 RepID=UPI0037BE2350
MKKIVILLIFILSSCGIEYAGGTKIVIKGKVVDNDNNPIENKEINLFVTRESYGFPFLFYVPSEENNIGKTITNSMGEYTIVIPKPSNNFSEIIVETNSNSNNLNRKQFRNIQNSNFINFELVLPTSVLYKNTDLATLNVNPNNVNPSNELRKIEFIGVLPNEFVYFNPIENELDFIDFNRLVKKNQTIILRYTVFNYITNTTIIQDENIVINNSNQINYTLNY